MFDSQAYFASSKTLKEYPPVAIHLANGAPVILRRTTVDVPGRFVDGALENWTVETVPYKSTLSARTTEVLGAGATRDEAIHAAEVRVGVRK